MVGSLSLNPTRSPITFKLALGIFEISSGKNIQSTCIAMD
jgi:hypothetical protein